MDKNTTESQKSSKIGDRRVHMANERTFLAWIRTSIGIMAFGFVVEKFAIFLKQISYSLGNEVVSPPPEYSSFFGLRKVIGCLISQD